MNESVARISQAIGCTLAMALGTLQADDQPPEIQLSDALWQTLPQGVEMAYAGPDGRLWYRDSRQFWHPEIAQSQAQIEAQFDQPSPQIRRGAVPVLFEPQGRVWFYHERERTLMAFDGEQWVVKPLEDKSDRLIGRCLSRGQLIDGSCHRFAGGAAWLKSRLGIYRYDGKAWSYQAMNSSASSRNILLSVHPRGTVAVAHVHTSTELWLFHAGKWTRHDDFLAKGEGLLRNLFVETQQSILYLNNKGLLKRLQITEDGSLKPAEPAGEVSALLGDWRATQVRSMHADAGGRIFVAANSVQKREMKDDEQPAEPQSGLIIHEPEGHSRLIRGSEYSAAWSTRFPPPTLNTPGDALWFPGSDPTKPAYLLDLGSGRQTTRLPSPRYKHIHAIAQDGRMIVRQGYQQPLTVHIPKGRKLPQLQVTSRPVGKGPVTVTGDGTIFAVGTTGELFCWHGGSWQTIREKPHGSFSACIPGNGGVALFQVDGTTVLCDGPEVIAAGDFFELLENEHERIVLAFGPGSPPPGKLWQVQIAASSSGQVWSISDGVLRLYVDDRWYDTIDALKAAGSRRGRVSVLGSIGDGERVYVSDLSLRHDGGRSFFGQLDGKKLNFTDAPHAMRSFAQHSVTLAGRDGALWVAATHGRAAGSSDLITGQGAVRVLPKGKSEAFENSGHALLEDQAGSVWLGIIRGQTSDVLNVWRDGQIRQQIRVPGYAGGLLCSDRPGSVFAMTDIGVQHLIADEPDYLEYRLGREFEIPRALGKVSYQAYSADGEIVLGAFVTGADPPYQLHRLKLPTP